MTPTIVTVRAALTDKPATSQQIAMRLGVSANQVSSCLARLCKQGLAERINSRSVVRGYLWRIAI